MPRFLSLDVLPTLKTIRASQEAQLTEAYREACASLGWGHVQSADPLALRRLAAFVVSRAQTTVTIYGMYGESYEMTLNGK
jgi:hypothetical protein